MSYIPAGEEHYQLKNALFTACKTGNANVLLKLLEIHMKPCAPLLSSICDESNSVKTEHENTGSVAAQLSFQPAVSSSSSESHDPLQQSTKALGIKEENIGFDGCTNYSVLRSGCELESKQHSESELQQIQPQMIHIDILNDVFGELNSTLLHVAAREGHPAIVKHLLEGGADPTIL